MNDTEIAQNGEIPMEYEYDERDNWDVWAAMIDAKLDAMMEHKKDHPRPQEGDGEVLMDHVEKRVESALVDYKKEIHQYLSNAMANVEQLHLRAIASMHEVSEKCIHDLNEKHVQTVLLNQSLSGMSDVDEIQQQMHENFYMERQHMLDEVDKRLALHAQKWEKGHGVLMENVRNRMTTLEDALRNVMHEMSKFAQMQKSLQQDHVQGEKIPAMHDGLKKLAQDVKKSPDVENAMHNVTH